ncbi:MAG: NAD(P)/FAD-dependent oxidoreductase [Comamonadaceae bacterium]|nr:NAD(P)/FAD-dependent oxidoreductase [Comamonadaceae bacterium]
MPYADTPPLPLPEADAATMALAMQARAELALLSYPDASWVQPTSDGHVLDVLIVGGGQSGLGTAAALRAQGVTRTAVLDRAAPGQEGVWDSFARMPELRTPKQLNGLDMGLPALSVQRWYIARFGEAAWAGIDRIPRLHWMEYLRWYRATLQLPVVNGVEVLNVRPAAAADSAPSDDCIAVDTLQGGRSSTRLCRLVVLATGMDGAGAWRVPAFIADALPADCCHHSSEAIDFNALQGQRVGVLGHGAAAFDNAVAALRAGAHSVDLCFRRARLPRVNPHRHIENAGLLTHYARLPDAVRWQVASHFRRVDQPPPRGSFQQACSWPNFTAHAACPWDRVHWNGSDIEVDTPQGGFRFDQVICATGHALDLSARPELQALAPVIARWQDRFTPPADQAHAVLAAHPYLGEHYECLPREADSESDWVTRVFAFNSLSYVSHGPHSTSISGHKHALPRLVRGLTQRLFLDQAHTLVDDLQRYDTQELDLPEDFGVKPAASEPTPSTATLA